MKIAAASLVISSFVLAQVQDFPRRWQYRSPLLVQRTNQLSTVVLDRGVYAHSRSDLADLRVVRATTEIAYILETLSGSVEDAEYRPEVVNKAVIPRRGLEMTLETRGGNKHSRLRISSDETNFQTKVRIETSDDNRHWAIARASAYIFDFSQGDRHVSVLSVDYPPSIRRYVRATFFGWNKTDAVRKAWLDHRQLRPAERQTIATVRPSRTEDAKSQSSLLLLDLGEQGLPHDRVRLDVDSPVFYRAIEVESSHDAKAWRYVGQGVIFRVARGDESLAVTFPEQHDRHLRLRIFNRDDRPVSVTKATLECLKRQVKFLADTQGEYWLYYGNADARKPTYDLAQILARHAPESETAVAVGVQQKNPIYSPPPPPAKPWSDRHPALLYGTLATAIVSMGYITIRFLAKVKGG
jgi:hypothetical protein